MDLKTTNITKTELADLLGVNNNTITKYIKEGMPTINTKPVNLHDCVRWALNRQTTKTTSNQNDAKLKLIEAQTKRIELQIEERRGEVVEIEVVKQDIQKLIEKIKTRLNSLVTKLPPKLEGKNQVQIGVILKDDIKKTLEDMTKNV